MPFNVDRYEFYGYDERGMIVMIIDELVGMVFLHILTWKPLFTLTLFGTPRNIHTYINPFIFFFSIIAGARC